MDPAKRPRIEPKRLADLRHGSYASYAALEQLMRKLSADGIPEVHSRRSQARSRSMLATQSTPYGNIVQDFWLPQNDGTFFKIAAQHPMAMLHVVCKDCGPFRKIMLTAIARTPPSPEAPWSIAVYCDEVGHNMVGHDNRKVQAIYWSFLELGSRVLHTEAAWFTVMAVRSYVVARMPSQMSNLFRIMLKQLFFNTTNGFDFRTGVVLPLDLGVLNAVYKCFVADESALHQVLRNMGASGFRPCPVHYNVCQPSAARPLPPNSVDMKCVDLHLLKKHDDATVREVLDSLRALGVRRANGSLPIVTKDAYDEAQTSYGWHDDPNGILMDDELNVGAVSTLMHCFVHMYLVSGIFNVEMQFVLVFLHHRGIELSALCEFVKLWVWPKHTHQPHHIFSDRYVDLDKDKFKCEAHEAIAVYMIVAVFLQTMVPAGTCDPQVLSFLLLADVLDLLMCVKDDIVDHDQLRNAIVEHLRRFLEAYGGLGWLVKHHLAIDLADALERFKKLLSLLVHERKHKVTKRWSKDRFGLRGFERGLLEDLTLSHMHAMSQPWCEDGLVDATPPSKKFAQSLADQFNLIGDLFTSRVARVAHGGLVHAGDYAIAMIGGQRCFAEVLFHVRVGEVGRCMSCLCLWEQALRAPLCVGTAEFDKRHGCKLYDTDTIVASTIVMLNKSRDCATVIIPPFIR